MQLHITPAVSSLLFLQLRVIWPEAVIVDDYGPRRYPEIPPKNYLRIYPSVDAYFTHRLLRQEMPHIQVRGDDVTGDFTAIEYLRRLPIWP